MKKLFMLIAVVLLSAFTVSSQEKVYKIGDLYDVDGVKGIVFSIEEGGRHGKIVALENSADYVYWGNPIYMISTRENYRGSYPTRWYRESIREYDGVTAEMVAKAFSGATDLNDGAYNCNKIIRNYHSSRTGTDGIEVSFYCIPLAYMVRGLFHHTSLPKIPNTEAHSTKCPFFPISEFTWYDATTNWYIPAIYELQDLYNACAQDGLNEAIQNAGGKPLKKRFWSSTEAFFDKNDFNITYSRSAYAYDMSDGYDFGWDKNGMRLQIRLIRRF